MALGVDNSDEFSDSSDLSVFEWMVLIDKAFNQEIHALTANALKSAGDFPNLYCPEAKKAKMQWIASVFTEEEDTQRYVDVIKKITDSACNNNMSVMLLKGYGLSLNYPSPALRPLGDIDIWTFGKAEAFDRFALNTLGCKLKKSELGHHSEFSYRGLHVENHYELSNTYFGGKAGKKLEHYLQKLAFDERSKSAELSVFLPSANFNAVYLLWHMGTHICINQINLRHLSDWYVFIQQHHTEIDWPRISQIWKETKLDGWADAIGGVMMKYFNMPREWMPTVNPDERGADLVMNDVLNGSGRTASGLANIAQYSKNDWKYRLVTGRHWLFSMIPSVWMHIAHKNDLIKKEIS